MAPWSTILCVDWGKDLRKRRAWTADPERRAISPLEGVEPTLEGLLAHAESQPGRTLVALDAALGVPRGYFDAARQSIAPWNQVRDFPSWLVRAIPHPQFLDAAQSAGAWRLDRPFIAVPKGPGSLQAFWECAGGPLMRGVDTATRAKCVFIASGIPGTVGSGTRALWMELAPMLGKARSFGLWPFDGSLASMHDRKVVLGEIYPRVCYALALAAELPAPLESIAKTNPHAREDAVRRLSSGAWGHASNVRINNLARACENEDDFDAMISAVGLLRCVLEGHPLEGERLDSIEGGILGLASLNIVDKRAWNPRRQRKAIESPSRSAAPAHVAAQTAGRVHPCPIPGCSKLFTGSRGGWDAHVASLGAHPRWEPLVIDAAERKQAFRKIFPAWFSDSPN